MVPTLQQMLSIGGNSSSTASANASSVIQALGRYGTPVGLDLPHRLAQYLAQLAEESGGWKWDRELASGAEYEGRHDLGNTQAGDGVRFKGRTMGQITGRANYRAFTKWVRANVDVTAPDFEAEPDLLNTDPWEGLGPIWFWATHKLNALADEGNIEQITKRWNGGLNGYPVRVKFYVRAALVIIGVGPDDVTRFQRAAQIEGLLPPGADQIDGDAGVKTRAALHQKLIQLSPAWVTADTKIAPVVETITNTVTVDKPVAVVPKGVEKRTLPRIWSALPLLATPAAAWGNLDNTGKIIVVVLGIGGVAALLFFGERIAMRAKAVLASFES